MIDVKTQLKKLILDDDFTKIQNLVSEEINLMSILRIDNKELPHSNLLAWLFNPNETHGLGDFFIHEFIKLYYKENEYENLGAASSNLSVFDFVNLDFSDLEIKREYKNIDILITSESNKLCILIENKIFSTEGKQQLSKYRKSIEGDDTYKYFNHKIFIYLSLFEQSISEKEYYVQLTYEHIKTLISQILENRNIRIKRNTTFVLEQYLYTLKSIMNDNTEIEDTAKLLYKKYRPAFDLVFKYVNSLTLFNNNLEKLIKEEKSIRPFKTTKSYIRFQPDFLYENIEKLKQKNYLAISDDLTDSYIFLFEFNVGENYINFDMKIGEYSDTSCRKELYDLFKKNASFFNKVTNRKSLSEKWHLVFRREIITKSRYTSFLDSGESSIDSEIENNFISLIKNDLPKIEEIILNENN